MLEYCQWAVQQRCEGSVAFEATQSIGPYSLRLVRTVTLTGRTVTSHTSLSNLSEREELPVSWFPHPFFPYPGGEPAPPPPPPAPLSVPAGLPPPLSPTP
eukprot:COSAG04_NODE_17482_length_468_cov_1.000000_1_plen_99_part_10